jgi:hypothetical protein
MITRVDYTIADTTTKTFIPRYRLEAKLLSFAVAGETPAEITTRTALAAAYCQAADDIQALWTSTYTRELNKQREVVSRLSNSSANLAVTNRQLHLLQSTSTIRPLAISTSKPSTHRRRPELPE